MVVHPEQTTRDSLAKKFSEVTIRLTGGQRLDRRVDIAKGQPQNPLTDAELEVKFRDCAARALPADRIDPLLAAVRSLESVPDVSAVCRLLRASGAGS